MIRRNGAQRWKNVHVTKEAQLADLIDIDNSVVGGPQPVGFALLKQAAREIDGLVQQARQQGTKIRALGAGWALTDIAVTDGWLLNTKLLNGCFDMSDRYFEAGYPAEKRPFLVLAQCGISIGELNVHLEVTATAGFRRALKTAGIGAGQTVAGSISGNTHGSAINFGATPDYLVGLQVVTGSGKSLWIERASQPILNDEFLAKLDAERIRDDDVFNAAIVSFGAFGVITALAIETDPIYQLQFPPVNDIAHNVLKHKLENFDFADPPGLYHYEFVFDPYSANQVAMEALATKVDFEAGHPVPKPVWIVRSDKGFAPGDTASATFFALPFLTPAQKTAIQFKQYRERCILGDVRATPGQCFTATISYFEGYTESAIGVSIDDAAEMIDISTDVIKEMKLPSMSQVRVVHPSKALLGFTHLGPKTAVFEFGLPNDPTFPAFEEKVTERLKAAGLKYTLHWSKNSLVDPPRLEEMYGAARVTKWRAARQRVFKNDTALMQVFENDHLVRAGLA
jgi:FAD/FMN-containing dehydrogenase